MAKRFTAIIKLRETTKANEREIGVKCQLKILLPEKFVIWRMLKILNTSHQIREKRARSLIKKTLELS